MLNSLIEPIMVSMGVDYKSGKVKRKRKARDKNKSITPAQREELLMDQFMSAGIPIDVKS